MNQLLVQEFDIATNDKEFDETAPVLHMTYYPLDKAFQKHQIPYEVAVHRPNEIMVTGVGTIHCVINTGFVVGAAWNILPPTPKVIDGTLQEDQVLRLAWSRYAVQMQQKKLPFKLHTKPVLNIQELISQVY